MRKTLEAINLLLAGLADLTPENKEKLEMVGIDCEDSALKLKAAVISLKKLGPEAS